jgi:hypothetical protein
MGTPEKPRGFRSCCVHSAGTCDWVPNGLVSGRRRCRVVLRQARRWRGDLAHPAADLLRHAAHEMDGVAVGPAARRDLAGLGLHDAGRRGDGMGSGMDSEVGGQRTEGRGQRKDRRAGETFVEPAKAS